jgi:GAF domain-containing protein/HAMP domain-containing protein
MSHSNQDLLQKTPNRETSLPLQTRLVLFVLSISLVPLIAISIRDIQQTQLALINGAEISLKSSAEQTANSLDAFVEATRNSVRIEAQLPDFSAYLSLPASERSGSVEETRANVLLEKLRNKDIDNIISYSLADIKGDVVLDTVRENIGRNDSTEDYFTNTTFTKLPGVTAVTYSDATTTIISFASIVPNNSGETVGVLRITYNSDILQQVITESVGASTEGSVLLLDQFNIRMADIQNPELVLKSIVPLGMVDYLSAVDSNRFLDLPREEQATNYEDLEAALKTAREQPFFRADITPNTTGDDVIAVAFLTTQPWVVVYSRPSSIFLADVQKQTQTNAILVIGASIIVAIIATFVARALTNPIIALTQVANSISQGNLSARAGINSTDEIGTLASAFNSMADQLQSTLAGLEQRIYERTADLQKNTLELETIADVAREISIIRDMDTLLNVSAGLIRERLQYYHVGIFLVDELGEYAILRAASSVAAQQMLEMDYKLRVGQTGLVGSVTSTGQAYIARDIAMDTVHLENPYLPDTQSEITLPLRSRSITIGALDIQANIPNAFDERDFQTLQILADQLAAAIENAELVQKVEGTLSELTRTNRAQTQQTWQSAISEKGLAAYEYDGLQVRAIPQSLSPGLLKQLENGQPIVIKQHQSREESDSSRNTLMIPLTVLNQVIGVIGLEQEDPTRTWTDDEIKVAQAAANRAALTLENARLLDESQRRATKERAIFESTARIGSALNIENILQTTAEEIERILSGSEVVIQFTDSKKS